MNTVWKDLDTIFKKCLRKYVEDENTTAFEVYAKALGFHPSWVPLLYLTLQLERDQFERNGDGDGEGKKGKRSYSEMDHSDSNSDDAISIHNESQCHPPQNRYHAISVDPSLCPSRSGSESQSAHREPLRPQICGLGAHDTGIRQLGRRSNQPHHPKPSVRRLTVPGTQRPSQRRKIAVEHPRYTDDVHDSAETVDSVTANTPNSAHSPDSAHSAHIGFGQSNDQRPLLHSVTVQNIHSPSTRNGTPSELGRPRKNQRNEFKEEHSIPMTYRHHPRRLTVDELSGRWTAASQEAASRQQSEQYKELKSTKTTLQDQALLTSIVLSNKKRIGKLLENCNRYKRSLHKRKGPRSITKYQSVPALPKMVKEVVKMDGTLYSKKGRRRNTVREPVGTGPNRFNY